MNWEFVRVHIFEIVLGSVFIGYLLTRYYEYCIMKKHTIDGEQLLETWLKIERVKVRRKYK